jgi:SMODS-associated NUDIX domain
MVVGIVSSIVASLVIITTTWAWNNRKRMRILITSRILKRNREVRVSVAALLRVCHNGQYLLFHVPFVPNTYGPPGGVIKYQKSSRPALDQLEFRDQVVPSLLKDMECDLRGFVPARKLSAFVRWFESGVGRESSDDCLRRELAEELEEVGFPDAVQDIGLLRFRFIRTVTEGPTADRNTSNLLLRIIAVYELDPEHPQSAKADDRLFRLGGCGDRVLLATSAEIARGRAGNAIIGSQSCLLYGSTRSYEDPAAITS